MSLCACTNNRNPENIQFVIKGEQVGERAEQHGFANQPKEIDQNNEYQSE